MNESRLKKIPVIVISFVTALFLLCLYLFVGYQVPVDDTRDNVRVVKKDGKISFEFSATDSGEIEILGEISQTVLFDYENGIKYHYYYMSVKVQRFHMLFNKDVMADPYFVLDETGKEIHGGDNWQFDPTIDYAENPSLMSIRYLCVFYENKDGSLVQIWEHPQAKQIKARVGTHVKEPSAYKIDA